MPRKTARSARPWEVVINELGGDQIPWDLNKHLNGCLAGYQADQSFSNAVYFALEALWGIAQDVELRAESEKFNPDQLDADWTIGPTTSVPVPWIWIAALAAAWSRYERDGEPLAQAFGLEGGRGKSPIKNKLAQRLNKRAIARWIWSELLNALAMGKKKRIEDVVQDAAVKFDKSDVTIRRAWQRFGRFEKKQPPK